MSTKMTLASGDTWHLYADYDDREHVWLEYTRECGCYQEVKIPLYIFKAMTTQSLWETVSDYLCPKVEVELKYWAGIGSRKTPKEIQEVMTRFAAKMSRFDDWVLRSGGAEGADTAFENGTSAIDREIFKGQCNVHPWAFTEVRQCLPPYIKDFNKLTLGVQKLVARNMMIIMGEYGEKPCKFVVCWTPNENEGGTSYGLRCARRHGIPIFNLHERHSFSQVVTWVDHVYTMDFLEWCSQLKKCDETMKSLAELVEKEEPLFVVDSISEKE